MVEKILIATLLALATVMDMRLTILTIVTSKTWLFTPQQRKPSQTKTEKFLVSMLPTFPMAAPFG